MLLSDDRVRLVPLDESFVDFLTTIRMDWANYDYFFDFHMASRQRELDWIARATIDPTQANFVILPVASHVEPIGTISLTDIDPRSRHAEYGRLFVAAQQRGSGVAGGGGGRDLVFSVR
jgi:RimJ/RimL family protein N-acetyltransferase